MLPQVSVQGFELVVPPLRVHLLARAIASTITTTKESYPAEETRGSARPDRL